MSSRILGSIWRSISTFAAAAAAAAEQQQQQRHWHQWAVEGVTLAARPGPAGPGTDARSHRSEE